ncbi:hypothetical protein C8Q72DRAFT_568734 [Fomitopsis betulina]|nr:hypothetical protein C8Q72DRAFT_568734 [Fomitopsis betulina]
MNVLPDLIPLAQTTDQRRGPSLLIKPRFFVPLALFLLCWSSLPSGVARGSRRYGPSRYLWCRRLRPAASGVSGLNAWSQPHDSRLPVAILSCMCKHGDAMQLPTLRPPERHRLSLDTLLHTESNCASSHRPIDVLLEGRRLGLALWPRYLTLVGLMGPDYVLWSLDPFQIAPVLCGMRSLRARARLGRAGA